MKSERVICPWKAAGTPWHKPDKKNQSDQLNMLPYY